MSIGTGIWIVGLVVLVLMRSTLDANGTTWWIGVAAVGTVSGLLGLVFLRWRKGRMQRRVAQEPDAQE